ncbi:MAG TPA: alpha/beta fold hydrolase, partial [Phenylobacterium sp.]
IDRGAASIPVSGVKIDGGRLTFAAPSISARYEGTWDAARQRWTGHWLQGAIMALDLDKGDLPPGLVIAGLDGQWRGALAMPTGAKLRLVLNVRTGAYGTLATFDSPDQLAFGVPVATLTLAGSAVSFAIAGPGGATVGSWAGALSADGKTLDGVWAQGASRLPLQLVQGQAPATARSQTPKPPFPYRTEDVAVDSAPGVRLAGTLSAPQGKGPFPAVVMITGSGAQDRDEALFGHKPFLVIADALTRRGVAVLRLDDRGVFGSTGDFSKAVTADFAIDAEAAARYLRGRPDIDPRRVGLIGHSEGGVVAPMVAAADPKIAFAVLLAPPGAPLGQLLAAQRLAIAPSMGMDPKAAEAMNTAMIAALAAMQGARDDAEAEARATAALKAALPGVSDASINAQAKTYSSNWMRQLLAYDPRPNLRKMRIPVLAVIGSKDQQVIAAQNLPELREALKGDPKATVLELPGLNHLLQTAPTGAPGEYADIDETVAPAALTLITDWVVKQTAR